MAEQGPITGAEIYQQAKAIHEQIRNWRREIHRYPELTFTEHRTAGLVNAALVDLGIETETEVAKTGVIGHILGGAGPLVGLRADMDALPILEESGVEYSSSRPGIMHACGHDAHTAMLLGAAVILQDLARQGRLPGQVRLLFQPSEEAQDAEGKSGGMRMVEENALAGLDAVFGVHVDPLTPVGAVSTRSGPMMAAADSFDLIIHGRGGHAARPHLTVDPILLASHVVQAIHHIVSRRLDPTASGVITVGTIQGGTVGNVIPEWVQMSGTIRSFTPESRQVLYDELRRACGVAEALGGSFELNILDGYPPTVTDETATGVMMAATRDFLGEENVRICPQLMGAEDFSYMAQQAPGSFLRVGTHDPSWDRMYYVHTPQFRMNEDALPVGAAALAAAAVRWMQEQR
jgi:IAA-amino acid hydrolase